MYNFLVKNGQLAAFGLGLLITIIFFSMALSGGEDPERFNFGLAFSIILAIACAAAMFLFGMYHMVTDIKGSMKGIITFGTLLILFGIIYATSDPTGSARLGELMTKFDVSEGTSKFISGAIGTTLALVFVALASFAFSEVRNFFK